MTKPRPIKLYAIVQKKKPRLEYLEIYKDTDIKIQKDEEIWEIEARAIKVHKTIGKKKKKGI